MVGEKGARFDIVDRGIHECVGGGSLITFIDIVAL